MKKCLFAGALSICIFLLSGCSSIVEQINPKLPRIIFEPFASSDSCTIDGIKYFSINGSADDKKSDKKIAVYYHNYELQNEAFTIKGYENKDFILLKSFAFMETLSRIYVKEGVERVPWELASVSMPAKTSTLYYNEKNYYYFSPTPEDFQVAYQLGTATEKDCVPSNGFEPTPVPLYEQESSLYKIPDQSEKEWIAVKAPDADFYLLYWTEEGGIKWVPWAYFEMQRAYSFYSYPEKYCSRSADYQQTEPTSNE